MPGRTDSGDGQADRPARPVPGPTSARFRSFLYDALGDVADMWVLDLGCGNGWLSAEVVEHGGRAVGIDADPELLEEARRDLPGLELVEADLTSGLPDLGGRKFHRIVAQMVLMDMPSVDRLLRDIGHSLLPNGRFVFTLPHPAFSFRPARAGGDGDAGGDVGGGVDDGGGIGDYLRPGVRRTAPADRPHHHRPLGWYVALLAESGMAVVRLFEAPPGDGDPATAGVVAIPVTPGLALPVGRPWPASP
ncbi:MAG: class I SAM-dependent methyltransferase [Acidimicrobiales bacterium]